MARRVLTARFNRAHWHRWYSRVRNIPRNARRAASDQLELNIRDFAARVHPVVPKDTHSLDRSMTVYPVPGRRNLKWRAVEGATGREPRPTAENAFYTFFVEHGVKSRPSYPVQPHFFTTYRFYRQSYKSRLTRSIRRALRSLV